MASLWRAEVSIDGLSVTGPGDGGTSVAPPFSTANFPTTAQRGFMLWDTRNFYILREELNFTIDDNQIFRYSTTVNISARSFAFDSSVEDLALDPEIIASVTAAGEAPYLMNGVISLEKDPDAGILRFSAPAGAGQGSAARLQLVLPDDPLLLLGFFHSLQSGGVDGVAHCDETTLWFNFQSFVNGLAINAVALSLADTFSFAVTPVSDRPGYVVSDAQELTRYRTESANTLPTNAFVLDLAILESSSGTIEYTRYRGTDATYGAYLTHNNQVLMLQSSNNALFTQTNGLIIAQPNGVIESPTIQQFGALALAVTYTTDGSIYQILSYDVGKTWSTRKLVNLNGGNPATNPALLTGLFDEFFYFYCASGDILLQRSFDHGETLNESVGLLVYPGVTPQDFSVARGPGGDLFVTFNLLGHVATVISQDQGFTWSDVLPLFSLMDGTVPVLVVGDMTEQFYFSALNGKIVLQRSFDQGNTLFDAAPLVVIPFVPSPDFGAVQAPDSSLLLSYVTGSQILSVRSQDAGRSWTGTLNRPGIPSVVS